MSNPPDQYVTVQLTHDPIADLDAINKLANEGFRFAGVLAYPGVQYVVMGNYGASAT